MILSTRGLPPESAARTAALRRWAEGGVRSLALDAASDNWAERARLLKELGLQVSAIAGRLPVGEEASRRVALRAEQERMAALAGYAPCLWVLTGAQGPMDSWRETAAELFSSARKLGFRPALGVDITGVTTRGMDTNLAAVESAFGNVGIVLRVASDARNVAAVVDLLAPRTLAVAVEPPSSAAANTSSAVDTGERLDATQLLARMRKLSYTSGLTLEPKTDQVLDPATQLEGHAWAERIQRVTAAVTRTERLTLLRGLKATVFERRGHVVEVNLNRLAVGDPELFLLRDFSQLTDLSLEETRVTVNGLRYLRHLEHLEWLNLYRTRVGDAGLKALSDLPRLAHLPLGDTNITDAGLAHLVGLESLRYLGLRATRVTDAGLIHLGRLKNLEGLHLGETSITDKGLTTLKHLSRLERLWLHDTRVTDASVELLRSWRGLRMLYLYRTHLSARGARRVAEGIPGCKVFYVSAERPL